MTRLRDPARTGDPAPPPRENTVTLALAVAAEWQCRAFYEVNYVVVCSTVCGVSSYLQAGWRKAVGQ